MNQNIRSALLGGLAATFVVAAAFAPHLLSSSSQQFHQTSAVIPADPTATPSSDLGAPVPTVDQTATTAPPTVAAVSAEVGVVAQRVDGIDSRVQVLEATTTTVTAPVGYDPAKDPTCTAGQILRARTDGVPQNECLADSSTGTNNEALPWWDPSTRQIVTPPACPADQVVYANPNGGMLLRGCRIDVGQGWDPTTTTTSAPPASTSTTTTASAAAGTTLTITTAPLLGRT